MPCGARGVPLVGIGRKRWLFGRFGSESREIAQVLAAQCEQVVAIDWLYQVIGCTGCHGIVDF